MDLSNYTTQQLNALKKILIRKSMVDARRMPKKRSKNSNR
jgi:hypothetical protein